MSRPRNTTTIANKVFEDERTRVFAPPLTCQQPQYAGTSDPGIGVQTKRSLARFARTLEDRQISFLVVGHGVSDVVDDIILFCRQQGLRILSIAVPASLKLVGDGHFNAQGNRHMADLIYAHLDPDC